MIACTWGGTSGAGTNEGRETRVRERRGRQRRDREQRIDELVAAAERSRDGPADRAYWSLVYDLELAPMTTNRRQLAELGIEVPSEEGLEDEALATHLRLVIDALADLYTYLIHTDHLSDRELYRRLSQSVLDEPVHEICEGSGGREFIDMAGGTAAEDRRTWLAHYASDDERAEAMSREIPVPERAPAPFDRDRTLPRPP